MNDQPDAANPTRPDPASLDPAQSDTAPSDPDRAGEDHSESSAAQSTGSQALGSTPNTATGSNHAQRNRILRIGISVALFAAVLHFFVLPLFANFGQTWSRLRQLNPWLALVAVVLELTVWFLYGQTFRLLLPRDDRPSPGTCYGTALAASAFSNVVPAGAAGTVAVDYQMLHRAGVPGPQLVYAFGAAGAVTALILNIMLGISLVIAIPQSGGNDTYAIAAVLGVILVAAIALVIWALLRRTNRTAALVGRALGWIPGVHAAAVEDSVRQAAEQLRRLAKDRRRLTELVLISIAKWGLGAVAAWVVFAALGQRMNFFVVFLAFALAEVLAALPVSPGGLGIFEATMISTLVAFGTDHTLATAGVLAFRAINYWMPIPLGALAYVWVNHQTAQGIGVAPRISNRFPSPSP